MALDLIDKYNQEALQNRSVFKLAVNKIRTSIRRYLEKSDFALIMGVHPGFGGQTLIPSTLKKIQQIKKQDTIQIQVYAHTNTLNNEEKHILSSRINYYIRASITKTFNKTSNTFYEPAYSKNYKITTRNIIWI